MKTTSLPLSKKLAALNLGVESEYWWEIGIASCHSNCGHEIVNGGFYLCEKSDVRFTQESGGNYPAYTLPELLPVLKALSERKGWGENLSEDDSAWGASLKEDWEIHWLKICSLYSQSESLEGVEEYIEELIK